jgi:hypothetical protein
VLDIEWEYRWLQVRADGSEAGSDPAKCGLPPGVSSRLKPRMLQHVVG